MGVKMYKKIALDCLFVLCWIYHDKIDMPLKLELHLLKVVRIQGNQKVWTKPFCKKLMKFRYESTFVCCDFSSRWNLRTLLCRHESIRGIPGIRNTTPTVCYPIMVLKIYLVCQHQLWEEAVKNDHVYSPPSKWNSGYEPTFFFIKRGHTARSQL